MFGDLVNLYCSYCDFADYYFWAYREYDWREKYTQYHKLAKDLEKILAGLCE